MKLRIHTKELVVMANRLDRMSRHDLPLAVRGTINSLAFRMKTIEIEKAANKSFDYQRNKTLFRSMSGFTKAKGFNVRGMYSEAGIIKRSGRDKLAKGLAKQEKGGSIKKATSPTLRSRSGRNVAKKIQKKKYLSAINPVRATNAKGRAFIGKARKAWKGERFIETRGYIAKVKSFRDKKRGNPRIKLEWLYRELPGGKLNLKTARPFIKRAYVETMKGFDKEFIHQANRRLKK